MKVPGRVGALCLVALGTAAAVAAEQAVAVVEDAAEFCLDSGMLVARVSKTSGDLLSLRYNGQEMLSRAGARAGGYWSHNVALGRAVARVSMDPKTNGGERGEVSVKAMSNGRPLGSGPGGSAVADIEIRYCLERGAGGLYTYCIFEHPTNYPAFSLGEGRFCAKLNDDVFDWMTVDANRSLKMLTAKDWNYGTVMNMKEARLLNTGIHRGKVEHKYDYAANQFETRAWGWSSTERGLGVWLINPSVEYLSGGPTKFELCAHRDATFGTNLNAPAPPTLLNYWRSSHYGGSSCVVGEGEAWTKVIGPFLIYCNAGKAPDEVWKDALVKASSEALKWPYDWVAEVDYPTRSQRGLVRGRMVLRDRLASEARMTRLLVGLTPPDYLPPPARRSPGRRVDWQQDAKGYQFWVRGADDGTFSIPNIRPGAYTLHAIAGGVLGEFTLRNLSVAAGQELNLGDLTWAPVRYGRQLWDIGVPNRTGSEFFKGNDYYHWGWFLEYPKLFPSDVVYSIGKSDFRRDWFFEQVPRNENPANTNGTGTGRAATWKIRFEAPASRQGKATLRLALCGIGTRRLSVDLNGERLGELTELVNNATLHRDGIGGTWSEHSLVFDAALMKPGENVLGLTVPAGPLTAGVIYDYIRLELDELGAP